MKMYVADSLVAKLEAARNKLSMTGLIAAERNVAKFALQVVYDEPTVDAEPVVRCRDCVWKNRRRGSYCYCGYWGLRTLPGGFCHMGKMMDGGLPHNVGQTTGGAEDGRNNHRPGL